ncbi:MAG: TRAP transporter small permease [Deltaproteobacteria bacterium]|nr:TRAP transporter small permease [Deltaproteobacteria bacterium]
MGPDRLHLLAKRLSGVFEGVAGFVLIGMMLLTSADILCRAFGSPLLGTYELVSFGGGLVLGFSLPVTSHEKSHVRVDTLLAYLPRSGRILLHVLTRMMAVATFMVVGWSMLQIGLDLRATGETSAVLKLPYYPLLYAMAGGFAATCIALLDDLRQAGRSS